MNRLLSMITAVILWGAFIYTTIAAVIIHLMPHIFSWNLDRQLVIFIVLDVMLLQFLAWLYKKMPHKPKNIVFVWLEKVSLL